MIQLSQITTQIKSLSSKAIDSTPIGGIRGWAQQACANSRAAREIVRLIVYSSVFVEVLILAGTFYLITLGRVDAVVGALIGSIFTFIGGVLAVTIPAFMGALKLLAPSQPVTTTNDSTPVPPAPVAK